MMKNRYNHKMTFDLKGSYINRMTNIPKEEERFWRKTGNQKRIMKDNNFKEIAKDLAFTLVEIDNIKINHLSKIIQEDA